LFIYLLQHCIWTVFCHYVVARDVFKLLATKYKKLDLVVGASFFEIYSGKVNVIGTVIWSCW